jgi:hypothetical protein
VGIEDEESAGEEPREAEPDAEREEPPEAELDAEREEPRQAEPDAEREEPPEAELGAASEWLGLVDFSRPARNAESVWLRVGAFVAGLTALLYVVRGGAAQVLYARPLPRLTPDEHVGYRYGLSEETRRAIFAELAAAETGEAVPSLERAKRSGDRGSVEASLVWSLAARHRVSTSAIWAVLEQGIRERWPGPDGAPLRADPPFQDARPR